MATKPSIISNSGDYLYSCMQFLTGISGLIRLFSIYALLLISFGIHGQSGPYRSASNPHYWKNKKPYEGYWQQDVSYNIKARIDEKTDIISASEQLVYYNNSPDTLRFVYFHLYQNAFQPESYFDDMTRNNGVDPVYGKYEADGLGTMVDSIRVNGYRVQTEFDNTILKVWLPRALMPDDSVRLDINFRTWFDTGSQRRRMKKFDVFGQTHYDGVHWYPRIAVYDHKFGWETDQHLEKEFYGNFGTYEVELDFSDNYVVEATGELQNSNKVMPAELRKKLDIRNFAAKPMFSAPSVVTPYDPTKRKTWKYRAINVHDFAFTADPTYRIGEVEWNGVKCIAVAQEANAAGWQNAAEYTAKIIKTYSEGFGMYIYPKIVVADARDGMEYPMLTLDGGWDPGYRDLLAHEVGHNWFYGMIGSNETYRAFMDEGFTQFITTWGLEQIDGPVLVNDPPKSKYVREFTRIDNVRDDELYLGYMPGAIRNEETNINRHSNDFHTALRHNGGYRYVYYKTGVMLFNLQYVLGDSLFQNAMRHYVEKWKIAHPYPEDFKKAIMEYTKADLNWFFDQWIESSKNIDYSICSVKPVKGSKDQYAIRLKRKGRLHMPLDIKVTTEKDSIANYYIPNTWFEKETNATILPKWFGWDLIQPEYTATVTVPGGIKKVEIDPTHRLADVNMRDNIYPGEAKYYFDSRIRNRPDWKHYNIYSRPDLWYNWYDGLKTGIHLNGNFADYKDLFELTIWINSGLLQANTDSLVDPTAFNNLSFNAWYRTPVEKIRKNSFVDLEARYLDGLHRYMAGLDFMSEDNSRRTYMKGGFMVRQHITDLDYLLYPDEWTYMKVNSFVNLGTEKTHRYKRGLCKTSFELRAPVSGQYDYSRLSATLINEHRFGKLNVRTRWFAQYGSGKNIPIESSLFLAGANPEELMENKFTRANAIVPQSWAGYGVNTNHFQMGGGLNLRGYAGYLVAEEDDNGDLHFIYRGRKGAAVNAEVEIDRLFSFVKIIDQNGIVKWIKNTFKLNTYLFGDIGIMDYSDPGADKLKLAGFRADAGAGAALTIKKFGDLQKVNPLVIRFDMPIFLNRIPDVDKDYIQWRWMLGINRAF